MTDHPSTKLPADKRHRLFQIASGEFAAKGFTQASLNHIISQMRMSKSSFYHYFSNKSDLFTQTFLYAAAPVFELSYSLAEEAKTADQVWPALESLTMRLVPIVHAAPLVITAGRMFYRSREDSAGKPLTEELLAQFSAWITTQLQYGQSLGAFRSDLPDSLLISLIMALGMSLDQWILEQWDVLEDAEKMRFSAAGFDLLKRMLAPTST